MAKIIATSGRVYEYSPHCNFQVLDSECRISYNRKLVAIHPMGVVEVIEFD